MFSMTRSLVAAQRDASKRVAEARRFSIRLPLVGTVHVPPPDQLAFYGVLGGLAALELIDWPVALAMGLGSALVARHFSELEEREEEHQAAPLAPVTPKKAAAPTPAKKASPKRAPAKKAVTKSQTKIGDSYVCEVCGLAVTVDDVCGCVETCDILCCDAPMKKKRSRK
jgi:cation-transporting ATPase I